MWKDFKDFISRGNIVDLAVAFIIGAAFTRVVTTFVQGIISPIIGLVTGGIDFRNMVINLSGHDIRGLTPKEISDRGWAVLRYGDLITEIINFLIVAFVVFLIARALSKYLKALTPQTGPTKTEVLLEDIRNLLQQQASSK